MGMTRLEETIRASLSKEIEYYSKHRIAKGILIPLILDDAFIEKFKELYPKFGLLPNKTIIRAFEGMLITHGYYKIRIKPPTFDRSQKQTSKKEPVRSDSLPDVGELLVKLNNRVQELIEIQQKQLVFFERFFPAIDSRTKDIREIIVRSGEDGNSVAATLEEMLELFKKLEGGKPK
jgi:hypothetical protein